MTINQARHILRDSLEDKIKEWVNEESGEDAWEGLGTYVGDGISRLMADAAMLVIDSYVDLHEYMKSSGLTT